MEVRTEKERLRFDIGKLLKILEEENLQDWHKFIIRVCIKMISMLKYDARERWSYKNQLYKELVKYKNDPLYYKGNNTLRDINLKTYWQRAHHNSNGIPNFKSSYIITKTVEIKTTIII